MTDAAINKRKVSESRAPRSARARALRRVLRTPVTVIGAVLVICLVIFALAADQFSLPDPNAMDAKALRMPPGTPGHPLGTDNYGRDILSRSVHGARLSLFLSLAVVSISAATGAVLGVAAGYFGGFVDTLISRTWDVLSTLPGIILFMVMVAALGPGIPMLIIAMSIGGIPWYGRLVRERVLSQRSKEYVEAAKAIGASQWRIMFRHVLPNCLTPVLVAAALAIPGVIMGEAGLSYLGLGIRPPQPSWGQMISEGQTLLILAPWISMIPGAFILLTTLGFNLVGDGLRDYFDPTQLR
jgi:peptide/nickel transport system permease protein